MTKSQEQEQSNRNNVALEQDNSPPLMISVDELNSEGYELPGRNDPWPS